MSVLLSVSMFGDTPTFSHPELLSTLASTRRSPNHTNSANPHLHLLRLRSLTPPGLLLGYLKKRSLSDLVAESAPHDPAPAKRSRTAPPSPPSAPATTRPQTAQLASLQKEPPARVSLPSLLAALAAVPAPETRERIVPTVLLDYFDTYKPNDENWRYGLLDRLRTTKPQLSLASYGYLNAHALGSSSGAGADPVSFSQPLQTPTSTKPDPAANPHKLPPISELSGSLNKPLFDSRVAKPLPSLAERKINFPYESNYTYLNKTYMTDVERYPEYLELAQSLILLSRPRPGLEQASGISSGAGASGLYQSQQRGTLPPTAMFPTTSTTTTTTASAPAPAAMPFTPETSFNDAGPEPTSPRKKLKTKFIPITPPSVKNKTRSELMRLPPRHNAHQARVCISCGLDQSPCWRPSWSIKEGQLCNSCGLRFKKTLARCLNRKCKKIPAKGEWALMQTKGKVDFGDGDMAYRCLDCGWKVEVKV